jgi:putative FmdB family regulatory protein
VPTYQYVCTQCDTPLEAVQSFSDAPLTECPACSGTLRKVFSAVGVVFKGSGFYKNDSRGKSTSSEPPASSETRSETKSESSTATKTESKPAATPVPSTPSS